MNPQNPIVQLIPLFLIFIIFYLVMILPMRRRQKKHQEMLAALTKGDRVITTGGIYGIVVNIEGDVVTLKVAENVKIQVARGAVAGLAKDASNVTFASPE
ncbi:MAG: preprotein translocase subunit YajC [Thermoanaerobaculum sp.]|nr:preprotein translocase subunit YajC [Thermoanaerobaculum sp.]MDW7968720.1 preprotein translocase subunit YajC [Thermoanaerobaculum sp.]